MIEMLVVVAIIGVLASAVLYSVTQSRSSGNASRCRANLRNLGQAVMNLTTETGGYLPAAGGCESYDRQSAQFHEYRGWVNWIPKSGQRPQWPQAESQREKMMQPPWYGPEGLRGIREGTLWADKGMKPLNMLDLSAYVCPLYKRRYRREGDVPGGRRDAVRSYAMNSYFGYAKNPVAAGCSCCTWPSKGVRLSTMDRPASRTLLFAEMQVSKDGSNPEAPNGGDQVLDAERFNESIGFYHLIAGDRCGHVVFVDGHVEVARERDGNNPTKSLVMGRL